METLTFVAIPAVLIALNQIAKKLGMPSKFAPIVNIVGGIGGGLIIELSVGGAVAGLLAGLSAGGVYSGFQVTKRVSKK